MEARIKHARQFARSGEFLIREAILEMLGGDPAGYKLGKIAKALGLPEQGFNAVITG